jgi:RNA polymerase sigma factor (TIGR02999 family)
MRDFPGNLLTSYNCPMATPPPPGPLGPGEITSLLEHVSQGDRTAFDRLFPLVYHELRLVAHRQLSRERPDHTLDSVALVNEAYLRLVGASVECQNRSHFFGIASRAMRTILIDYARARLTLKRGSGAVAVPLEEATAILADDRIEHLVSLDEALRRLEDVSPEASPDRGVPLFRGPLPRGSRRGARPFGGDRTAPLGLR